MRGRFYLGVIFMAASNIDYEQILSAEAARSERRLAAIKVGKRDIFAEANDPEGKTLIAAHEARNAGLTYVDRIQRKTTKTLKAIDAAITTLDATFNRCGYIDPALAEDLHEIQCDLASFGRRVARFAERYAGDEEVRATACSGWSGGCGCFACEERDEDFGIKIQIGGGVNQ